jgi:hypothetical protein
LVRVPIWNWSDFTDLNVDFRDRLVGWIFFGVRHFFLQLRREKFFFGFGFWSGWRALQELVVERSELQRVRQT